MEIIFFFFLHIKKILKILLELPFNSTLKLNFHSQLEMNGILYAIIIVIKDLTSQFLPIDHANPKSQL